MRKMSAFDSVMCAIEGAGLKTGRGFSHGLTNVSKVVVLSISGIVLGMVILVWAFVRGALNRTGRVA